MIASVTLVKKNGMKILPQVVQGFYVIVAVVLISSVVIYHYARTPDFMERTKKTISTTLFDILKFVIPFQVAVFFLGLLIQFILMLTV